jgi:hypothetical protein
MKRKQTAVEWLVQSINERIDLRTLKYWNEINEIVDQAKAMEKEQIEDAYENGETDEWNPCDFDSGKKYYTSTYGQ